MDPFEARLQFSRMLSGVQPSTQILTKCASFALRNYEYQEDFHSCILEVLETGDLLARLNIMNFIDTLVSQSKKSFAKNAAQGKPYPYVDNIRKDLPVLVAKVVPANKYGLYNLRMCFDILRTICLHLEFASEKISQYQAQLKTDLLSDDMKAQIEQSVPQNKDSKEKSQATFTPIDVDSVERGIDGAWQILLDRKKQSQFISYKSQLLGYVPVDIDGKDSDKSAQQLELTREQMLARMEADRERHKKAKESLWVTERESSLKVDKLEFKKLWDQYGPLLENELKELSELSEIAEQSYNL